jgi:hypothetical protein
MKREDKFLLPLLVLAALGVSCSSSFKSQALSGTVGGWYSVTANATSFYRYGPQQAKGPDLQLPKDSIMKVIRPSFGYVKVQLQDGANGYVASEDIRPASATLVAEKLAPPPQPPPPIIAGQDEQFRLNSDDPRLVAPPEPLPEASPTPDFRY